MHEHQIPSAGGNMCRLNRQFLLPPIVAFAVLVTEVPIHAQGSAQSAIPAASPTSSQANGQAPSAEPAAQPVTTAPQFKPTPEQFGDALFGHQRYQAAIEAYKKAPRDSADVWNKMGIAYQMMFNLQAATRCYRMSLKFDSKNPRVLNNLGTVYDSLKEYGDAERMYRKAAKIDPSLAIVYKNLGTSLLAQHKFKKGWEVYKTALTIDPNIFKSTENPRVENPASVRERGAMNYYMARGCVRAGMNDCAIEYLRMALNEGFTDPKKIEADSEFASLRGIPAFEQLLVSQRSQ
jgi:tetratricopeptide (TPR) repeat protein